ncbi:hypothetical protein TNCV_470631 [Trichonephila clavipes]|nr:hypothetical protein TNCV_470631 [Trichonephila clavipes]
MDLIVLLLLSQSDIGNPAVDPDLVDMVDPDLPEKGYKGLYVLSLAMRNDVKWELRQTRLNCSASTLVPSSLWGGRGLLHLGYDWLSFLVDLEKITTGHYRADPRVSAALVQKPNVPFHILTNT